MWKTLITASAVAGASIYITSRYYKVRESYLETKREAKKVLTIALLSVALSSSVFFYFRLKRSFNNRLA